MSVNVHLRSGGVGSIAKLANSLPRQRFRNGPRLRQLSLKCGCHSGLELSHPAWGKLVENCSDVSDIEWDIVSSLRDQDDRFAKLAAPPRIYRGEAGSKNRR